MNKNYILFSPGDIEDSKSHQEFATDVLTGLSQPQKRLSCRFIYDDTGSKLFSSIMDLPEYYPTECETEILNLHKESIMNRMGDKSFNLIELGAGDGIKTRILLNHFLKNKKKFNYTPIDISEHAIKVLTEELSSKIPELNITGLVSEYFTGIRWLANQNSKVNVILFLGSNIGNFTHNDAKIFLSTLWNSLNDGDFLLIGFDLKKDISLILKAYNDSKGLTARFNLNLLKRINSELGGNFDCNKFEFYSTWDPFKGAIISSLISNTRQTVHIDELSRSFYFLPWEPIHTESSYKYNNELISDLASTIGFEIINNFYDSKNYFVDSLWQVKKD